MNEEFKWLNPPASWSYREGELSVRTDDRTDFWRKTEYGFIRDNGHFWYCAVAGDFSAEVTFAGQYQTLYDQAGLMIRLDEMRWIKTGIEFTDDVQNFSTVVTNDLSDWSLLPLSGAFSGESLRVRMVRRGTTITTAFQRPDGAWQTARIAGFAADPDCQVGMMCCSPQRAGFEVQFSGFALTGLRAEGHATASGSDLTIV